MWTLKRGGATATIVGLVGIVAAGCLDRNVVSRDPSVNTIVSKTVTNQSIDKVDLLFVLDNSASMGDKQQYLAQAVPQLITRLVTPNCVDTTTGTIYGPSDAQGNGTCTQGTVEFPPVHDMHIGLLSSSLGTRLSDQYGNGSGGICPPTATVMVNGAMLTNGNDDRAELLNRSGPTQVPLADAGTSFYLNWFPAANAEECGQDAQPGRPTHLQPVAAHAGLHGAHPGHRQLRLRHRVAARELVPVPRPAGSLPVDDRHERARAVGRGRQHHPRAARTTSSGPTRSWPSST